MNTTSLEAPDSMKPSVAILPFPLHVLARPKELHRAVARVSKRCARGDGRAMLDALSVARGLWDGFEYLVERSPCSGDELGHITLACFDAMKAIAAAPAKDRDGMLAKARLLAWLCETGTTETDWMVQLARDVGEGVERLIAGEARAAHV
jgi:hypothetical protein